MTRATVSADGETITVHIPLTFRKRGGRKLVVTPDGAAWAPRPRVDNAMVKALARAFRWRKMLDEGAARDARGFGAGEGRGAVLREPGSAVNAARAGHRGGDPRRAAAERGCSWMIYWRGFRWSGKGKAVHLSAPPNRPRRCPALHQGVDYVDDLPRAA